MRLENIKNEEMASLGEEDNHDPVSVELGELKARALRLSEQLALLSTSSKGLLEGDGEDQQDYGAGHQDPPDVVEHQVEQVQQGLDEKMIGESELSSPESSLVETEDIPGMESVQERWGDRKSGMRRKMELKISSPTPSIMKSFSPTASPLSSPLSSPTKSSKAKKTISFLLPDSKHEEPVSPAAGKGDNDAKEKLEAIQKKKEEDEAVQNGKEVKDKDKREEKEVCDEVRTEKEEDATEKEKKEPKTMSVEKRQRRVYEYPDLKTSSTGYRYGLAGGRYFWKMPFRHQLFHQLQNPQPAQGSDSEDEISPPATPTQDIPEQQRSVEDLDPRIFAPTGDIYSYFERRRLDPHLYTMPLLMLGLV